MIVRYFAWLKNITNIEEEVIVNKTIVDVETLKKFLLKKYPKLIGLKLFLLKLSSIIFARMSGSGSSILAYFYSKKAAEIARKEFRRKFNNYWCITSKTI